METKKKQSLIADLILLGVAFLWGSGFVASKNALETMSPMMLATIRFTIATLLSAVIFHKHLRHLSKETLIAGGVVGLFLFSAFSLQIIGLQYILAGKQAFLTGTNVIMVPFIYWAIKKKRPDRYHFAAAFIMLLGLALLTIDFQKGFSFNLGDVLTLMCAVLYAAHIVAIGHYTKRHDPLALTVIQLASAAVLSVVTVIIFGELTLVISKTGLWNALYLGIFSTFLAFLGQMIGQKNTSPTHAAIVLSLESVFGSILAVLFLSDRLSTPVILGCIVIFVGIITAETKWSFLKSVPKNQNKEP